MKKEIEQLIKLITNPIHLQDESSEDYISDGEMVEIVLKRLKEIVKKEKYYEATIKWSDNGNIEDDKILKIGDIDEDDDDIFFYLESEEELESFKNIGHHEWTIIEVTEIINYKK